MYMCVYVNRRVNVCMRAYLYIFTYMCDEDIVLYRSKMREPVIDAARACRMHTISVREIRTL